MKKVLAIIFMMICTFGCLSCKKEKEEDTELVKHLITEADGSYGGSLNKELYGEGAPLNGCLDSESVYYTRNDYYNLSSSETRTNISNFASYQQTMANSDGIACLLMIMNHDGISVNKNKELELVKKYEELNSEVVYNNGTSPSGLKALAEYYGYTASIDAYKDRGANNARKVQKCADFIKEEIEAGNIILVRFQDGIVNRWHIVLGVDTMGTTVEGTHRDDVIIFADPFDANDHYQDGYSIQSLGGFWKWWRNVDKAGNELSTRDCVVITPKTKLNVNKADKDSIKTNTNVPEKHLLLNLDGSFGGTYNDELYGSISEHNGYYETGTTNIQIEHTDYNYYAKPDYYNMTSNNNLSILTNYRAFEQTMASSCGPSSLLSVLEYYKYDFKTINNKIDENDNSKKQEELVSIYMTIDTDCTLFKNYGGVGVKNLGEIAETLGYSTEYGRYYQSTFVSDSESCCFATYESFKEFVKGKLNENKPIIVCFVPFSGHFEVIIGYDDMGTDSIYDDVVILADPHDVSDHYQDGYNTYPGELFYSRWYNSTCTVNQAWLVVNNK